VLWAAGFGFLLWGCAYEVRGGLAVAGVWPASPDWGDGAATWYVVLWGPMWMLGGALFLAVANACRGEVRPVEIREVR
jgi:hypothetical protein